MKHASYGILDLAVKSFSDNAYLKLISKLHLTPTQMEAMYASAWEQGFYEKLEPLLDAPAIEKKFKILGPLFHEFRSQKKYHMLPLPEFENCSEFADAVSLIENKKDGILKRYGIRTKEYGVVFLNNMYFLRKVFSPTEVNVDELLALDHTRLINKQTGNLLEHLKIIQGFYSIKRYFSLITGKDEQFVTDTYHMLKDYHELNHELLSQILPAKPKTFKEIHDEISKATSKLRKINLELKQDLFYLEGEKVYDYEIEVPKDSHALIDTSVELKHCVHTYADRVIRKESQIINLTKDGKRIYTIELKLQGRTYVVVQFKGYMNLMLERAEEDKLTKVIYQLIEKFRFD